MRLRMLARRLHEPTTQLCGFELSKPQKSALDSIWAMLTDITAADTENLTSLSVSESGLELLFQLLITFWTEIPGSSDPESTTIAHFSGVLGIHPSEYAFRRAYDYTPFLSSLIWVGRLVLLEYALPLRPYKHLSILWPRREDYSDLGERLCDQIRPKYL
jgi:hypothetical protein